MCMFVLLETFHDIVVENSFFVNYFHVGRSTLVGERQDLQGLQLIEREKTLYI